ncbi:transporter AcrB/D/F family protein [Vibrio cholerae]|nr:transporter AcrB/D/F family protein [Vibrio cholerae]
MIVTPYPGATAQEVSDEVTDVIEGAVQALCQILRAVAAGMGQITP